MARFFKRFVIAAPQQAGVINAFTQTPEGKFFVIDRPYRVNIADHATTFKTPAAARKVLKGLVASGVAHVGWTVVDAIVEHTNDYQ